MNSDVIVNSFFPLENSQTLGTSQSKLKLAQQHKPSDYRLTENGN